MAEAWHENETVLPWSLLLPIATSAEFQDDDVAVVGKGGKAVISIEKEPRLKLAMLWCCDGTSTKRFEVIATSFCRLYLFGKLNLQEVEDLRLCLKPAGGGTIAEQASGIFSNWQSSEMSRWTCQSPKQTINFWVLTPFKPCDKGSRDVQESNYVMICNVTCFWLQLVPWHCAEIIMCQAGVKLDVIAATPESAIESASAKLSFRNERYPPEDGFVSPKLSDNFTSGI